MEEKSKKAVIYIDTEDEITDVVNKIKDSNEKIIALVPPKGIGILRSAVNLRILERTSKKAGKKIVLVSNNSALKAMAGSAQIPVAKTLQSKPEIPQIDALEVDGEDVIDGEKLPVSEFAKQNDAKDDESEMLSNLDIDDNKSFSKKVPTVEKEVRKKSDKIKIPDFNKFRKKIFIFGGLGVVLIIFLVWAIFFAPAAKVIISAKTANLNISNTVNLTSSSNSSKFEDNTLAIEAQTIEKNSEVEFDATGTKEEGTASSGKLTLSQSSESDPITIKAGTAFSAGECNFVTTSTATIPGVTVRSGAIAPGRTTVEIRATQIGDQCNLAPQRYSSAVDGISAQGAQLSGGTKTIKKVVSENDLNTAKAKIVQNNTDAIKNELKAKFGKDYIVLEDSFAANAGEAQSSVAVGSEANGKVSLKANSKYSISAISKKQIGDYLNFFSKSKLSDSKTQKIYSNGLNEVEISDFSGNANSAKVKIRTTAKVGPKIDETEFKNKIQGKIFSEVQNIAKSYAGVNDVEVKFSQFWVNKVPANNNKIEVEFTVKN